MVLYLKDFVPTNWQPNTTPLEDWCGFPPDISHLRPFSCMAYAKVPTKTDGGKLAPCSIKCVLIGYSSCDAYCLLDKTTGKLYQSRDVIFEEGVGHCMLHAQPVLNKGELNDHVVLQPTGDTHSQSTGLVLVHMTSRPTIPQPVTPNPQPSITQGTQ